MTNFQADKYFGTWYEQAHVKEFDIYQPVDSKCIEAKYTSNGDGTFKVENTYQSGKLSSEMDFSNDTQAWGSYGLSKRTGVTLHGKCGPTGGSADCFVSFTKSSPSEANYRVLDTDYENYSLVYNCEQNS